jgi:GT2 family glycosyltransferase
MYPFGGATEIIVIDNASADGSADMVQQEFPECRLIRSATNDGYGVAINHAAREAAGRYLLLLNPDIEVTPGCLDTLVSFTEQHPRAGVVSPRLLLSDGRPQASARRRVSIGMVLLEMSRLHLLLPRRLRGRLMMGTYDDQTRTRPVDWVSGACHLIPREVWNAIGPLTEETFCGFDDYDYCYRTWRKGYAVWLCTSASMVHHCSVAVRARWTSWEVEQVSIHNSYVVLSSHWPAWRVRLFSLAELMLHGSEYVRHWLVPRRSMETVDEDYGERVRKRLLLTWNLFRGTQAPIRRCQRP